MRIVSFPSKQVLSVARGIAKHAAGGDYKDYIELSQELVSTKGGAFGSDFELSFFIADADARHEIAIAIEGEHASKSPLVEVKKIIMGAVR